MRGDAHRLMQVAAEAVNTMSVLGEFERLKTKTAKERMDIILSWSESKQREYWAFVGSDKSQGGRSLYNQFRMRGGRSVKTHFEESAQAEIGAGVDVDVDGLDGLDLNALGNGESV